MRGVRPMPLDLRPLTLAELLDRSFSVYKRHFWLFVGIMAVPAVFAMVVGVLTRVLRTPLSPNAPPDKLFLLILPAALGLIFFALVYLVVYTYALGAATIAVSELYLGRDTSVGAAYLRVRPVGGRLLLLIVLMFLAVVGATLVVVAIGAGFAAFVALISKVLSVLVVALAIPGVLIALVVVSVRFGVSVPALVIENVPARAALKRSVELTGGNAGRVFLVILCAIVVAYASSLIFQGPFAIAALVAGPTTNEAMLFDIAGAVSGAIGNMITSPIPIIGLAIMYYDLRIRKEALDLELLLSDVDTPRAS